MCAKPRYRIDDFAVMVHPRDGHHKIFAMIDAYLDESGIHGGAAVCMIAGYFGGRSQLRKLEIEWLRVLKKFNFPLQDFHAKDLLKQRKHEPMLLALSQAIAEQRKVHPVSLGIVVEHFNLFPIELRRWMTGGRVNRNTHKWIDSGCPSKPYFCPFVRCLQIVTDCAPVGGKAHFFFGLDRSFSDYATQLFKQIKEQINKGIYGSEWTSKGRLGEPSFPLAAETPQLQAADLFVHLNYQRALQNYAADQEGDWMNVPVSEMLANCLHNSLHTDHHSIQNKKTAMVDIAKAKVEQRKAIEALSRQPDSTA